MTLTDYNRTRQGKLALFIDHEFAFSVTPELFVQYGLEVNMPLDVALVEELRAQSGQAAAKQKALQLLSYKAYAMGELQSRLERSTDRDTAQAAVQRMQELGLVNDEDYARRFARDLMNRRKFGPIRARQEMRRKGLDPQLIEQALEEASADAGALPDKLRALVEKKYPLAWEDETARRRAFAAMLRMGYPADEVRRVLRAQEE